MMVSLSLKRKELRKRQKEIYFTVGKHNDRVKSAKVGRLIPKKFLDFKEEGIILKKPKSELYLSRNLTLSCLHNLVLKIMIDHYNLHSERKAFIRRNSDCRIDAGGKIQKEIDLLHFVSDRDALYRFYAKNMHAENNFEKNVQGSQTYVGEKKITSLSGLSPQNNKENVASSLRNLQKLQFTTFPWFLDRNPSSLKDSLEGLKKLILKFACTKENIGYLQPAMLESSPEIFLKYKP